MPRAARWPSCGCRWPARNGITRDNAGALAQEILGVEGPVLVFCGSGNRVGALFALDAYHARGADAEAAVLVGKQHGLTRAEPLVRAELGLPPLTEQR